MDSPELKSRAVSGSALLQWPADEKGRNRQPTSLSVRLNKVPCLTPLMVAAGAVCLKRVVASAGTCSIACSLSTHVSAIYIHRHVYIHMKTNTTPRITSNISTQERLARQTARYEQINIGKTEKHNIAHEDSKTYIYIFMYIQKYSCNYEYKSKSEI